MRDKGPPEFTWDTVNAITDLTERALKAEAEVARLAEALREAKELLTEPLEKRWVGRTSSGNAESSEIDAWYRRARSSLARNEQTGENDAR